MIKVYRKTQREVEAQQGEYNYGAMLAHGIPFKACPTYIVDASGQKKDTSKLSEDEILRLILNDVADYVSPKGSYSKANRPLDTMYLVKSLEGKWEPSYRAILVLLRQVPKLRQISDNFAHMIFDIIGTVDKKDTLGKTTTIAAYLKETRGDFSRVTFEETLTVLEQLVRNKERKQEIKKSTPKPSGR